MNRPGACPLCGGLPVLFAEITDCPRCQLRATPPAPAGQEPDEPAPSTEGITIFLVGCGKTKRPGAHPAGDLYVGGLFRSARRYVEARIGQRPPGAAIWMILSAKHGAIDPERVIEAYEQRLPGAQLDRARWGHDAATTLRLAHHQRSAVRVEILAGADYAEPLRASLPAGWQVSEPLAGLGVGERLAWFKKNTPTNEANP